MGQAPSSGSCCSPCEPSKQPDVEQVTHRPASVFQESTDGGLQDKEPEEVPVDVRGSNKTLDLTLTDRQLLRGIPFCQTLWRGGRVWRHPPDALSLSERSQLYASSKPVQGLDRFLSHTWLTPGWRKVLSLLLSSGWPCMLTGWVLGMVVSMVLCMLDVLPLTFETEGTAIGFSGVIPIGHWVSLLGTSTALVGLVVSPYLPCRKRDMCFLDVACIHQGDQHLMQQGINNLGTFLEASEELLVLWDTPLFSRLWCVFELAAFSKLNPKGKITIAPIYVEAVASQLFLILLAVSCLALLLRIGVASREFLLLALASCALLLAPLLHSLRGKCRWKMELDDVLANFDVLNVDCTVEVDKANIHAAIERWYGSLPAFSEFVQGLFRAKARELTRTPGRMPLGYIYMLAAPAANWSLDVWLGLWKAGASSEGLVAWFVGGFLAFTLLWYPTVIVFVVFSCERWAQRRSSRLRDYLQTLAIYLLTFAAFLVGAVGANLACNHSIGLTALWTLLAMLFSGLTWYFCWLR
ncbi:unnamed protein product [Symbiodinium sp. CCMP2592]|nr:unnamed protein product [Symbiodinium sp. CCMP2592]